MNECTIRVLPRLEEFGVSEVEASFEATSDWRSRRNSKFLKELVGHLRSSFRANCFWKDDLHSGIREGIENCGLRSFACHREGFDRRLWMVEAVAKFREADQNEGRWRFVFVHDGLEDGEADLEVVETSGLEDGHRLEVVQEQRVHDV